MSGKTEQIQNVLEPKLKNRISHTGSPGAIIGTAKGGTKTASYRLD